MLNRHPHYLGSKVLIHVKIYYQTEQQTWGNRGLWDDLCEIVSTENGLIQPKVKDTQENPP